MAPQYALGALRAPQIPQLNRMFARSRSQHMLRRSVDFPERALPSSPAEATRALSKGNKSVSRTGAVWPRARGTTSGILEGKEYGRGAKGQERGRMANALPPDAFQLMLKYC